MMLVVGKGAYRENLITIKHYLADKGEGRNLKDVYGSLFLS